MDTKPWVIALVAFCALIGSVGQLLFKLGSISVGMSLWSWVTNLKVVGGIALHGFSAILFIVALKHGKLSVLYPVIATSYVWVALISAKFLGEPLSVLQWVGIVFILGGVALVVRG